MSKSGISKLVKKAYETITAHSPEILTGIGIAGMVTAAFMAVKATPKALSRIDDELYSTYEKSEAEESFAEWLGVDGKSYTWEDRTKMFTPIETIKLTWKYYIPALITASLSVACLIGANSVNTRRNAALATAYSLSESALKRYSEKVVDVIGEKKENAVRDAIAKDIIDQNPVSKQEIVITSKGDTLCYDVISGQYFKSDIDRLKKAENELNRQMLNNSYVSLNDFYYEIGLNNASIGDDLGWNINDGFMNLRFSSQLAEDGTPCIVLDYNVAPKYSYRRHY